MKIQKQMHEDIDKGRFNGFLPLREGQPGGAGQAWEGADRERWIK